MGTFFETQCRMLRFDRATVNAAVVCLLVPLIMFSLTVCMCFVFEQTNKYLRTLTND